MSSRRGVLMAFGLFMLLAGLVLAAWGPLSIGPMAHRYADTRTWLGVPNGVNVLVNLPMFWLAVWGWCVTHTSPWPRNLRLPWQWFHLCVMAGALSAAMYHAAPGNRLLLASHLCMAGAFVMLSLGLLAERLDARFGSLGVCTSAAVAIAAMGAWLLARVGPPDQGVDLRPLIWLELLPVLLIPAGVLRLPCAQARSSGWVAALALYACSKLLEWSDTAIFQSTGWISGHTLMHVAITAVVGWMAYRAAASSGAGWESPASPSQRRTSLNTLG
jgi:hypothetical protein